MNKVIKSRTTYDTVVKHMIRLGFEDAIPDDLLRDILLLIFIVGETRRKINILELKLTNWLLRNSVLYRILLPMLN